MPRVRRRRSRASRPCRRGRGSGNTRARQESIPHIPEKPPSQSINSVSQAAEQFPSNTRGSRDMGLRSWAGLSGLQEWTELILRVSSCMARQRWSPRWSQRRVFQFTISQENALSHTMQVAGVLMFCHDDEHREHASGSGSRDSKLKKKKKKKKKKKHATLSCAIAPPQAAQPQSAEPRDCWPGSRYLRQAWRSVTRGTATSRALRRRAQRTASSWPKQTWRQ